MHCLNAKEMTFKVLEIDANGVRHDLGKRFTISIEESDRYLGTKYGQIRPNAVFPTMLRKLFNFTNPNGFTLSWEQTLEKGTVFWRSNQLYIERVL